MSFQAPPRWYVGSWLLSRAPYLLGELERSFNRLYYYFVGGPPSSTDNGVPTFDGTSGRKLEDNSGVTITGGNTLNATTLDADTVNADTFSSDGDMLIAPGIDVRIGTIAQPVVFGQWIVDNLVIYGQNAAGGGQFQIEGYQQFGITQCPTLFYGDDVEIQDFDGFGGNLLFKTELGATTITIASDPGTINLADDLTVGGDIAVTGTVDGRDVATDGAKLDGIEAGADVTDATNVDAAGAVMNGDTTTAAMSFVIDEDNMASNLATKVPTQQSVKAYVDASSGGFTGASSVSVKRLTPVAISNTTWTAVDWNGEDWDDDGWHSTSANTDRITVDFTGILAVGGAVHWEGNTSGRRLYRITKNGTVVSPEIGAFSLSAEADGQNMPIGAFLVSVTSGDIIRLEVYQTSGGNLDFRTDSRLQAWRVS